MTNTQVLEPREERGYTIFSKSKITQIDQSTFLVPSQSKKATYQVQKLEGNWVCECPDFQFRAGFINACKHIYAVQMWLKLKPKNKVEETPTRESEVYECKYCKSPNVTRFGVQSKKQRYYCKDCGKAFVAESITSKMKFNPEVVTMTLDLYYKGVSLRNIQDHLNQIFGVKLNHQTVLNWISKYEEKIGDYVKTLKPELSGQWHVDEMKVKFGGNWKWLWNVMDKDTRYVLASNITEKREVDDARQVFALAKEVAKGQKPERVISDGLQAYKQAFNKEFFTLKNPRTEHISHIRLSGDMNNNIIERLHGTKREREKVMRGLKTEETAIIPMQDIYYNFVRPHKALNGETPAQATGVGIKEQNKWLGLIKKSIETNNQN